MTQPRPQPDAPRPPLEPLEKQLQRLEKLAGFAAQLATAMRVEFPYYWDLSGRRNATPEATEFATRVDRLRGLAARYLREVAAARRMQPVQAHHAVRSLDPGELMEAGKGLESLARQLRILESKRGGTGPLRPNTPAQWATAEGWAKLFGEPASPGGTGMLGRVHGTAPLGGAPPAPAGWLSGRLQGLFDRQPQPQTQAAQALPPSIPPGMRRLKAFEASLALVGDILKAHGPQLAVLRVGLDRMLPVPDALPAELRELIPGVAIVLQREPTHRQAAAMVVQRGVDARKTYVTYRAGLQQAQLGSLERVGEILRPYQIEPLKALVLPISNLHITFKDAPAPLDVLCRPPVVRAVGEAAPAVAPAPAAPGAPAPAPKSAAELSPEEVSLRRLSLIMTYMTDPSSNPALDDEKLVYRIVAEELAYQAARAVDMQERFIMMGKELPDDPEEVKADRARYGAALAEAREREADLKELLSFVTGQLGSDDEEG